MGKRHCNRLNVVVVPLLNHVWILRPHGLQHARFPVLHHLPEFPQTHVHWVDDAIQPPHTLCHPLVLLPSIFLSIRDFSKESALHIRWPKYWSFISTSVLLMNTQDWSPLGWTGWISLQSKGLSIVFFNTTVQKHQFFSTHFFIVQHSYPYMTTGKTIALTRQTFVGKVMSLLFNMLSRLVITFLPRGKCLSISWL